MAGFAVAGDRAVADIAANTRDSGCRNVLADQERPLLDVKFEIGLDTADIHQRLLRLDIFDRQADISHMRFERAAIALVGFFKLALCKRSRQHFRADIARAEPGAFLAAHGEHMHRLFKAAPLAPSPDQANEPRDNTGEPVEVSAERHAVHMGADDDETFGIAILRKREKRVTACIVPDRQPLGLRHILQIFQRPRLDLGKGRTTDAFHIRRHARDIIEQARGERMVLRPNVGERSGLRVHGAASMKTTASSCSPSITVPIRSFTDESPWLESQSSRPSISDNMIVG